MAGRGGGHKRADSQDSQVECPWLQPSVPKSSSSRAEGLLSPSGLGGASSRLARGLVNSSRENSGCAALVLLRRSWRWWRWWCVLGEVVRRWRSVAEEPCAWHLAP